MSPAAARQKKKRSIHKPLLTGENPEPAAEITLPVYFRTCFPEGPRVISRQQFSIGFCLESRAHWNVSTIVDGPLRRRGVEVFAFLPLLASRVKA